MRQLMITLALLAVCVAGCAAARDILLPGNDPSDVNRRFWDQTSDNPYR